MKIKDKSLEMRSRNFGQFCKEQCVFLLNSYIAVASFFIADVWEGQFVCIVNYWTDLLQYLMLAKATAI